MSKLNITKKVLSFVTCSALSLGIVAYYPVATSKTPTKASAKTIAEIQEERAANEAKIADYDYQLSQLEGDKANEEAYQQTLNDKIKLIKENIDNLNLELNKLEEDITTTENNITQLDQDIQDQQADIDESVETFKQRLCNMYVSGNDNLASIVLGTGSFYDVMSQIESANRMAEYDEKLINSILDEIDSLEQSKKDLESEKLTLEMKKQDQENKKAQKAKDLEELNTEMAKTQEVIDNLAMQENMIQNNKAQVAQYQAELDAEEATIREAEEAARREADRKAAEEAARQAAAQQAAQQSSQQSYSSTNTQTYVPSAPTYQETTVYASGFAWPTPGFYYISSPYGSRWGSFHRGIDVGDAGIHGAAACASKSGTVIAMNSTCTHDCAKTSSCGCGGGYGNYVLIAHDGGYSTMYAHLASVCVSVGDTVSQGQTIGYVGSTGWSTGAHLHFEVRLNGTAQNPMNYVG
ncbi:MAG TPA: peptidoglycan DD-metalloendopeptidase family protein [Ruminococcus sp.]|nr:peptidoglycan DD-metalloendopeptidase family protein [Ruminococcus sp.]